MKESSSMELEIGAAIRQARIRRGISLEDTAARANLTPTAVRNLELGRGSTLRTMLKVLSVIEETDLFTDWIARSKEFSPIAYFRETENKAAYPKRVSRKRTLTRKVTEG